MRNQYALLGFARRAGKIVLGYDSISRLKQRKFLILLASDAAERTKEHIMRLQREVLSVPLTKAELGALLGAGEVSAAAVVDPQFADGIRKQLTQNTNE